MEPNLIEAERRIEEARRTGAEVLDLGDLALSELPASLGELPHLKVLCLGTVRPTETGDLDWDNERQFPGFTELAPLTGLKGLQVLSLADCMYIRNIKFLAELQRLRILDLSGTEISSTLSDSR